jgi:hypothetical protein
VRVGEVHVDQLVAQRAQLLDRALDVVGLERHVVKALAA